MNLSLGASDVRMPTFSSSRDFTYNKYFGSCKTYHRKISKKEIKLLIHIYVYTSSTKTVLIFAVENNVKFCHFIQNVSIICTAVLFSNIDCETVIHSDTIQTNRNKAWWESEICINPSIAWQKQFSSLAVNLFRECKHSLHVNTALKNFQRYTDLPIYPCVCPTGDKNCPRDRT